MRQVLPGHGASRGSALGRARVRLPHVLEVAEEHIQADAVDSFYVRGSDGNKVGDQEYLDEIRRALLFALEGPDGA